MAGVWFIVTIPSKATELSTVQLAPFSLPDQRSNSAEETKNEPNGSRSGLDQDNVAQLCMEDVLKNVFRKFNLADGASWAQIRNGAYHQVLFPVNTGDCETVLALLRDRGFGIKHQSTLSVLPCTLHYDAREDEKHTTEEAKQEDVVDYQPMEDAKLGSQANGSSRKKGLEMNSENSSRTSDNDPTSARHVAGTSQEAEDSKPGVGGANKVPGGGGWGVKAKRAKFLQSITSRLTVAQVVEGVRTSASLTFDFIMFILLAAMLAAMGLVENSSVTLVASMLVSPMMGPILAGTFGTVIQDKSLQKLGVKNELIGLVLCLSFGFVFGLIYGSINDWRADSWLTSEMVARGQLRSLWVGVLIALPSGAGVALSVLGGNAGSLVGVAISASLLPPVVNAGLLWALSLTKAVQYQLNEDLDFPPGYVPSYSQHISVEVAILGVVSLCLTIVNIICIFIMGVVVLRIKEVAPTQSTTKRFWENDIRIARDYNKTLGPKDGEALRNQLFNELLREEEEEDASENVGDSVGDNSIEDRETADQARDVTVRNRRTIRHWRQYMEQMQDDLVYRTVCQTRAYPAPKLDVMFTSPKGVTWDSYVKTACAEPEPNSGRANLSPYLRRSMSHETPANRLQEKSPQGSLPETVASRWRRRRFTTGQHPKTEFSPLANSAAADERDVSIPFRNKGHSAVTSPTGTGHNRRFTWNFHLPRPFSSRFTVTRARDDPLRASDGGRHHLQESHTVHDEIV